MRTTIGHLHALILEAVTQPDADAVASTIKRALGRSYEVSVVAGSGGSYEFDVMKDGRSLGGFSRTFRGGFVTHTGFWLEPEARGSGLGKMIFDASVKAYRVLGLKGIRTHAESGKRMAGQQNGAYTWARFGFDWVDGSERKRIAGEFENLLMRVWMKRDGVAGKKQVQWYRENRRNIDLEIKRATATPASLAEYTFDGRPLGKEFLLGNVAWEGVYRL